MLLQRSIKTYFLGVHPLLQNILNLPPYNDDDHDHDHDNNNDD